MAGAATLVSVAVVAFLSRNAYVLALVAAVLALDQLTKLAVTQALVLGESWPREGFFRITRAANSGSAFGLFGGQNLVLTAASVGGIALILWFFRAAEQRTLVRSSLALMLAGAAGNLVDRLVNGHVTDFIDIGPWYIFNVADSAIVVGVIILATTALFARERPLESNKSNESHESDRPDPGVSAAGPGETTVVGHDDPDSR